MKRYWKALGWAAACWLMSAQAQAQSPDAVTSVFQPAAQQVAYTKLGADCVAPACGAPACEAGCGSAGCGEAGCGSAGCCNSGCNSGCCGNGCCSNSWFGCCNHGDPYQLFKFSPCRQKNGWKAGGWIIQTYTWNPSNPNNGFNGPVTWTDRSNQYQLSEAWMYFEKATDTGGCGFDIGGRVDGFFGSNSRFVTETGMETSGTGSGNPHWDTSRFYGFSLPNAYIETAYNNLKIKWGRFVSPIGYMTVGQGLNVFNTIPYTYQYGEPFTHTGALATWTASDKLVLGAGITKGWDNFDNQFNPHVGYLGTATYTNDNGTSFAWVGLTGPEASFSPTAANQNGFNGFSNRYYQSLVMTKPLTEKTTWVMQSDYGQQWNATATGNHARWYGLNNYLIYKHNDCWTWAANFEWWRDEEGFRTVTVGGPTGSGALRTAGLGGYAGNFYQVTMGPAWRPTANLMIRPNARYDWYGGDTGINPAFNLPFQDNKSSQQFILGTDVMVTF